MVMYVCGIDVSTRAVDLVLVPVDDGPPVWHHYPLEGSDAWERTRSVPYSMPPRNSSFYDTVVAFGVENPAGTHGAHAVQRAVGAVLACLPPLALVQPWRPSQWRKAVGLKGNASKAEVAAFARPQYLRFGGVLMPRELVEPLMPQPWPQDACDAYCIAVATRNAITTEKAA